jgi:hypothetical protein
MEAARKTAEREDVSMNQLFLTAIAEKLSALETETFLLERSARADEAKFREVLSRVPEGSVDDADRVES